jgi:alkylated DNA repair dioxygenase AlkB
VISLPNLVPADGELYLLRRFMREDEAQALHQSLRRDLAWQPEWIVIAGKRIPVPRLVCWYGDAGAIYRYSGVEHEPVPWPPCLLDLKNRIEQRTGQLFNSVLGNYYRTGQDSMGWHADKERELGKNPAIASLSLGATRRFLLRHNRTRETVNLELASGSLLLMQGSLQHHWRHCVPKDVKDSDSRINLTFRRILAA